MEVVSQTIYFYALFYNFYETSFNLYVNLAEILKLNVSARSYFLDYQATDGDQTAPQGKESESKLLAFVGFDVAEVLRAALDAENFDVALLGFFEI